MKKFFDHLFCANLKCKFLKKESQKQKFKKQPFDTIIALILPILCLLVTANLHIAGQQTLNDTVMCQFILISLKVSAHLLYSDLEHRFKDDTEKRKSQKNSPIFTYLWITLEILILCTICVVISYILVQQAPHSPFAHLKTLEG